MHLLGISAIIRFARHVESIEPGSAFIFVVSESRVRRVFQSGNESRIYSRKHRMEFSNFEPPIPSSRLLLRYAYR